MNRDSGAFAPITAWGRISGRLTRGGFWPFALAVTALQITGVLIGSFWLLALASILFWPLLAAAVRRLHDAGRSGHWLWLLAVPVLSLVPIWLLTRPSAPDRTRFPSIDDTIWPRTGLALIFAALFVLRWTVAVLQIPDGSMKPGILPGDVLLVQRAILASPAACSPVRCPWGRGAQPARGDVVLFEHANHSYAKRVLGLPGERIAMTEGQPAIDAAPLSQTADGLFVEPMVGSGPVRSRPRCSGAAVGLNAPCVKHRLIETLTSGRSYPVLNIGQTRFDTIAETQIQTDTLFVLGDNRDNSMDSRMPLAVGGMGPVPTRNVVGRVRMVLFSVDGPVWQIWKIRPDRLFVPVK